MCFLADTHCSAVDTKHYWKLTKHIFRYGHVNAADTFNGAHTINEGVSSSRECMIIVSNGRRLQRSEAKASSRLSDSSLGLS